MAKDETQDECGSQTSNYVIHISEREFNVNSNKLKVNLKIPELSKKIFQIGYTTWKAYIQCQKKR